MAVDCASGVDCGENSFCSAELRCECEDGFFRSADFTSDLSGCEFSRSTVIILNSLAILMETFNICGYAFAVKRMSQFKRQIPNFLCSSTALLYALMKCVFLEDKFVGSDPLLSFLFGMTFGGVIPTLHLACFKYISAQMKLLQRFETSHAQDYLKRANYLLNLASILSILASINVMIFSSERIRDESRQIAMRIAFGIYGFGLLSNCFALSVASGAIIAEIKKRVAVLDARLAVSLQRLRGVRRISWVIMIPAGIFFVSGAVSEAVLKLWIYFLPVTIIFCAGGSFAALVVNKGRLGRTKAPTKTKDSKEPKSQTDHTSRTNLPLDNK